MVELFSFYQTRPYHHAAGDVRPVMDERLILMTRRCNVNKLNQLINEGMHISVCAVIRKENCSQLVIWIIIVSGS